MPDPLVVDTGELRRQAAATAVDATRTADAAAVVVGRLEALALAESDHAVAAAVAEASERAAAGLRALVEAVEGCSHALAAEAARWEEIESAARPDVEPS